MLFFYIRHGKPTYNPDELTPLGHRQAEAVGRRLSRYGIDKIYASTSNRAIQTAMPTCEILGKEPELLDFANEGHAWMEFAPINPDTGKKSWAMSVDYYKKKFLTDDVLSLGRRWYEHPDFADTKFKEGTERIDRETDALFASLGYVHDREKRCFIKTEEKYERVALFAHAGFGSVFLSSILDIPYPIYSIHFEIQHSGMTVIDFKERDGIVIPLVLQTSNDSHLYGDGLPTKYNDLIYF